LRPVPCFDSGREFQQIDHRVSSCSRSIYTQTRSNCTQTENMKENSLEAYQASALADTEAEIIRNIVKNGHKFIPETRDYFPDADGFFHFHARFLLDIHDIYEIPWWMIIAGSAVTVKLFLSPIFIWRAKITADEASQEPAIDLLRQSYKEGKKERRKKRNREQVQAQPGSLLEILHKFLVPCDAAVWYARFWLDKHDYYYSKGIPTIRKIFANLCIILPIQIYAGYEVKLATRCGYPGLSTEGILWFEDLTVPDPYFILPVIITLLSIGRPRLGLWLARDTYGLSASVPNSTVYIPILFCGWCVTLSASVQFLVLMNACSTIALYCTFRSATFRRLLNLPLNIGLSFSMKDSDINKVRAAFGPDFGKFTFSAAPKRIKLCLPASEYSKIGLPPPKATSEENIKVK